MQNEHLFDKTPQDYVVSRSAFDMNFKNMQPFFVYDKMMESERESKLHQSIKKGLSGHGARRDNAHIQTAMWHSLKEHPKLLSLYMNA